MGLAYIRTMQPTVGQYQLVEIVELGAGSPPERPVPQPPLGIWGPTDPRPTHPIAGIPGFPGYNPPGLPGGPGGPVDPGYSPPWAQVPGPTPGPGMSAIVLPLPPQDPPVAPPAGMPEGSQQVLVWYGPGTKPAMAWVGPYASTGPVPVPAGAASAAGKPPAVNPKGM